MGLFLQGQIRLDVPMRRGRRFVTEVECNVVEVHAGPQHMHRGRMPDTVRGDMPLGEAGMGLGGTRDSELQALIGVVARHRMSLAVGQ